MSRSQVPLAQRMPSGFSLVEAFTQLCDSPGCLWLDSSSPTRHLDPGSPPLGRYSFLTANPIQTIQVDLEDENPWPKLHELYDSLPDNFAPELPPFQGGIAGLWGYESAAWLEKVNSPPADLLSIPALSVGLYDWTLATDHSEQTTWLICQGEFHPDWNRRCELAEKRLEQVLSILAPVMPTEFSELPDDQPIDRLTNKILAKVSRDRSQEDLERVTKDEEKATAIATPHQHPTRAGDIRSNFADGEFTKSVQEIIDLICKGETFQVNLAQRLTVEANCSTPELYLRLRKVNAAPFSVYYHQQDFQIASSSPEGFLQVRGRHVETRPIKGTVPRVGEQNVDRELAEHLIASEKDRAENIMIVDLLRNDLSKACEDDSVVVTKLCGLEIYEHVQHLVSVVQGTLRKDTSASKLLEVCFPGGSVTGAPKIEAMKTIARLEPNRRGAYCGSIGYLGLGSQADFNILIRTVTASAGHWQFPVGGGITARSEPEAEEAETWAKAEGMMRAVRRADR